tara:strand:- start:87 stop:260 length:174 start_codon:yes stop_codon:yes gene_type:complete
MDKIIIETKVIKNKIEINIKNKEGILETFSLTQKDAEKLYFNLESDLMYLTHTMEEK